MGHNSQQIDRLSLVAFLTKVFMGKIFQDHSLINAQFLFGCIDMISGELQGKKDHPDSPIYTGFTFSEDYLWEL